MQETIRALSFNPNEEITEKVFIEMSTDNELQDSSQEMFLNQLEYNYGFSPVILLGASIGTDSAEKIP